MSKKISASHILVVEDDPGILEVLKVILTGQGFTVSYATKEAEAIAQLNQKRPALILLDLWLDGQSGLKLVTLWKSQPATRQIPIVIISAGSDAKQAAKKSQADAFLAKPFEVDELVALIHTFIKT